jgi:transposase-like protein
MVRVRAMSKAHPLVLYAPRRWTTAEAESVLQAVDRSGLSVAAFAAREGLDPQRLYFWRRRLRASDDAVTPGFVEVKHRGTEHVEIVLRSGRILRVAESIDVDALRRIAEALDGDSHC